ncbi:hypothetical protein DFH27DRAFT_573916 [Peziza echinospora]|nr:hypothetical protein DFH27DRAFT_573916 [Peziza echinospora]
MNDGLRDIASSSILPTPAEQMLVYSKVNRWSEEAEDAKEEEEEHEGCGVMLGRGADVTHSQLLDIFNTTIQSGGEKVVGEGVLGMNRTDGLRKVRKATVLSPINHSLMVSSSALNRYMEETAESIPESREVGREIRRYAVEKMSTIGRRIERNEVQIRGTQEQERRRVKDLLLWIGSNCVWCWGQDKEGWEGRCTWDCNRHEEIIARLKAAKHHLKLKPGKICFSSLLDQETCGKWIGKGKPNGDRECVGAGRPTGIVLEVAAVGLYYFGGEFQKSLWSMGCNIDGIYLRDEVRGDLEFWEEFIFWGKERDGAVDWDRLRFQTMLSFLRWKVKERDMEWKRMAEGY